MLDVVSALLGFDGVDKVHEVTPGIMIKCFRASRIQCLVLAKARSISQREFFQSVQLNTPNLEKSK